MEGASRRQRGWHRRSWGGPLIYAMHTIADDMMIWSCPDGLTELFSCVCLLFSPCLPPLTYRYHLWCEIQPMVE